MNDQYRVRVIVGDVVVYSVPLTNGQTGFIRATPSTLVIESGNLVETLLRDEGSIDFGGLTTNGT